MPIKHQQLPGLGSNSEHYVSGSYYFDNYIIQNNLIKHPKNLVIDALRNRFFNDSVYTYRQDEYGFPLTPDNTGQSYDTDFSTKILISDAYRYEVKFFPAIVVKANGGTYKPVSFNQNGTTKYRTSVVEDDYGGRTTKSIPSHRVYAGMWDANLEVTVLSRSHTEVAELADMVALMLQYSEWHELRANGLFIKSLSVSAENAEQYINDFIYSHSITLGCMTEWRVEIPLDNLVEKVVMNIESTMTPSYPIKTKADTVKLKFDDIIDLTQI